MLKSGSDFRQLSHVTCVVSDEDDHSVMGAFRIVFVVFLSIVVKFGGFLLRGCL